MYEWNFARQTIQDWGAMMWGRPTSPKVDQENIMELTRMYFVDETEHCIESKALAMARKYIRKHYPKNKRFDCI